MLLEPLQDLLERMAGALADPRPRDRLTPLALGLLCGDRPKTITSALHWLGQEQEDWSGGYRLLSQSRWRPEALFEPILAAAIARREATLPLFAAQDDTLLRKSGRRIPGTAYARDPLSPPFQTNLVWGQRFLQTSLLLRAPGADRPVRSIPVSFVHAPALKAKPRATPEEVARVKEQKKKYTLSRTAVAELHELRRRVDRLAAPTRPVVVAVDGSFANKTYLRGLPHATTAVARLRKNAQLRAYLPPDQRPPHRKYGPPLPTPQEYLQDERLPWRTLPVFVAGARRTLQYKVVTGVCWPPATLDRPLTLIVIKPAGYRLRQGSKLLYRQPAFLIVTEPALSPEVAIEAFLGRWEVEVNFREEKTGLGVGQAQVWNATSVARTPAFLVACYAALLLSCLQVCADRRTDAFGLLPAWRNVPPARPSLRDMLRVLRNEAADWLRRVEVPA